MSKGLSGGADNRRNLADAGTCEGEEWGESLAFWEQFLELFRIIGE